MTKDLLAQELKEKLKLGVKPSDLKKKNSQQLLTPPPTPPLKSNSTFPLTPPDSPILKPTKPNKPANNLKELQEQVIYWSQTAQTHLLNLSKTSAELFALEEENKHLKRKLKVKPETVNEAAERSPDDLNKSLEQALIEANQKIRQQEKTIKELAKKNTLLNKSISNHTNPIKTTQKTTLFTCHSCQKEQTKELLRLIDKNQNKICRNCTLPMLKRANQLSGNHIVLKIKKPVTQNKSFTCQTCHQSTQGEPHQVHITNFQESGIIPQQLTSICPPCLEEKVVLANFYCPKTSEGRDTYNPKEPQFDCYCPTSERREI